MGRIVLLGPTGYTGRLIAERLAGTDTILAGRDAAALAAFDGFETAVVDLGDPSTITRLLAPGDVLATTVGSFVKRGEVALRAAVDAGAHYLDTTGEAPFVRRVFDAEADGALITAMGFNYAPGNLAGALALQRAGGDADRLDIGYFLTGAAQGELSRGTIESASGVLMSPGFTWRDGQLVTERCGARMRTFDVGGRSVRSMTLGSSEAITLPAAYPGVRTVDVYQGGLGAATPIAAQVSRLRPIPFAARALNTLNGLAARAAPDGPDADARARSGTHVVAIASDRAGHVLEQVVLRGPNVYDITAALMAWGARQAAAGEVRGGGPQGPVTAFGLEALEAGHAASGMTEERTT